MREDGIRMAEVDSAHVAAARIIAGQAEGILPDYPNGATATQVLVLKVLLDQIQDLLSA